MIHATISLLVFQLAALPLNGQVDRDNDVQESASALQTAYGALQRGEGETARLALSGTSESLRGTPFRLMEQLAADVGPEKALNGKPAPKPDERYMLAVLHPTERQVVYVRDGGVIVVYDLTDAHATPQRIVSSRQKPLTYGSFSGDGESFAAGDAAGGITVWETPSWKERTTYVKGTQPVRYVSVDRDGSKMLAETEDGVVLWDIRGDKEIGVVADRYRFGTALCFSNATPHFATGGLHSVQIHDVQTGKVIREISHAPYTMQLCFSADGSIIMWNQRSGPRYFQIR